jgi:hypothetical protein
VIPLNAAMTGSPTHRDGVSCRSGDMSYPFGTARGSSWDTFLADFWSLRIFSKGSATIRARPCGVHRRKARLAPCCSHQAHGPPQLGRYPGRLISREDGQASVQVKARPEQAALASPAAARRGHDRQPAQEAAR